MTHQIEQCRYHLRESQTCLRLACFLGADRHVNGGRSKLGASLSRSRGERARQDFALPQHHAGVDPLPQPPVSRVFALHPCEHRRWKASFARDEALSRTSPANTYQGQSMPMRYCGFFLATGSFVVRDEFGRPCVHCTQLSKKQVEKYKDSNDQHSLLSSI